MGKGVAAKRDLGVLINKNSTGVSRQDAQAARKANGICTLGCIKHSKARWTKELTALLYSASLQPHLEVQFWAQNHTQSCKITTT